ncbi:MAG: hypothetical protein MJ113_02550 [Lachnospiraceae bacterium]|nr:hypothetical protein [Lachnospiraceae bacterium]
MAKTTTAYTTKYIETIIISFEKNFQIFHNTKLIRVKDKKTNLLVMVDFMPTLGELIDGTIEVVSKDDSVKFENVSGFYVVENNVFKLLLKEE